MEEQTNVLNDILMDMQRSMTVKMEDYITYTSSGLEKWDEAFKGFRDKGVTLLAKRPAMGSLPFMLQSAINNAKNGIPVLFFSEVMLPYDLLNRSVANVTGISLSKIYHPDLLKEDEYNCLPDLVKKEIKTIDGNLQFNTEFGFRNIVKHFEFYKNKFDTKIIYIDFKEALDDAELKELISLASSLDVSIVINYTLNRLIEYRDDKRPLISDLNDIYPYHYDIHFYGMYRDVVYNKDCTQPDDLEVISLNRNNLRTITLSYNSNNYRIE